MNIIIVTLFLLSGYPVEPPSANSVLNNDEISYFSGSLKDAFIASEKQGKPIFVDVYADWCGWCKKLDQDTFSNSEVIEYLNESFISLKLDSESPEGRKLAKQYRVKGLPTMLFLTKNGNETDRISGYVNAEQFLSIAKNVNK